MEKALIDLKNSDNSIILILVFSTKKLIRSLSLITVLSIFIACSDDMEKDIVRETEEPTGD